MHCEVVAVGTELLLGQIVDTNSAWIGERLALAGIDSHYQTKVGDNLDRIVAVLRLALDRSDAVIVCGGLGPTQDDITREAIAAVLGVELVRDDAIVERIRAMFGSRGRPMADNNLRQADVPVGATVIEQVRGTAPGLICPVGDGRAGGRSGDKVIYAVPGVPYEMEEMLERAVVADLQRRAGARSAIVSRTLRTWGDSESGLAEKLGGRITHLDAVGNPTLAFLASGVEGLKVRITARAADEAAARELIAAEEAELRLLLGDLVFGVDDETIEHAVSVLLRSQGLTLGVAESVTGGLIGARLTDAPGASVFFRGAIVSYTSEVKFDLLDVAEGPVVCESAAATMAESARRVLGADVGISVTGVAGPSVQDGQPPGTVFLGLAIDDDVEVVHTRLPGDRLRVRQFAAITLLNLLRLRLVARAA
ncbi:competence/damage-inducible protein A [soil metagenome]